MVNYTATVTVNDFASVCDCSLCSGAVCIANMMKNRQCYNYKIIKDKLLYMEHVSLSVFQRHKRCARNVRVVSALFRYRFSVSVQLSDRPSRLI